MLPSSPSLHFLFKAYSLDFISKSKKINLHIQGGPCYRGGTVVNYVEKHFFSLSYGTAWRIYPRIISFECITVWMHNRNGYLTAHKWYADQELTSEIIQQIISNNTKGKKRVNFLKTIFKKKSEKNSKHKLFLQFWQIESILTPFPLYWFSLYGEIFQGCRDRKV